jgi:hypothetical protein
MGSVYSTTSLLSNNSVMPSLKQEISGQIQRIPVEIIVMIINNKTLTDAERIRIYEACKNIIDPKWIILREYVDYHQLIKNVFTIRKLKNVTDCQFSLNKITHINFDDKFNAPVDNLPQGIKSLTFGWEFNQPVDNLPRGIESLTFGWDFNQRVDNLPQGIKHLAFGWQFNQPVDNLPQGIKNLKFGRDFNQPVDKLPQGIKSLKFGRNFNQPIDKLPQGIEDLQFGYYFNQPIDKLPRGIERLKFEGDFINQLMIYLRGLNS